MILLNLVVVEVDLGALEEERGCRRLVLLCRDGNGYPRSDTR
jgi:hypothetical protein